MLFLHRCTQFIKPVRHLRVNLFLHCLYLTRARIGHSHLTHAYLFALETPPQCMSCNYTLTIKHILLECVELANIRINFLIVLTSRHYLEIFRDYVLQTF